MEHELATPLQPTTGWITIKPLPPNLTASLNYPSILAISRIEESDDTRDLVSNFGSERYL